MAFFDKLNDIAKNLGDMTTDAIETTKLNSKISSEKTAINELVLQVGEYYYNKYQLGEPVAEDVSGIMSEIDQHNDIIKDLETQLVTIRNQTSATSNSTSTANSSTNENKIICPTCWKHNPIGTKFCQDCGAKLEQTQQPQPQKCPSCGADIADGLKFCGECGNKIE